MTKLVSQVVLMAFDMAMRHLKHILMIKILLHKKATKKVDYEELWVDNRTEMSRLVHLCLIRYKSCSCSNLVVELRIIISPQY